MDLATETTLYDMALPYLISIFSAVFAALLSFKAASYWFNRNRDTTAAKAISDRLAALESKALIAEQTIMPISSAFQAILVKQLTHYHTPELDALLAKLDPYTLTDAEERRFYHLLEERTRDMGSEIDASERNAAKMLPYVIKRVKEETDTASKVALQTVVVPMHGDESANGAPAAPAAPAAPDVSAEPDPAA